MISADPVSSTVDVDDQSNAIDVPVADGFAPLVLRHVERGWHLRRIHVQAAWQVTRGERSVIGIVDGPVDGHHPEFSSRLIAARSFDSGSGRSLPRDQHATKCAGVACAGGLHVAGVAPRARLLSASIGYPDAYHGGTGEAEAVRWAAEAGTDVILCPWGPRLGPDGITYAIPDRTRRAIDWAVKHGRNGRGCVIVWSAGNDNADVGRNGYASHPCVIAVGSTNALDFRASYSNYGDAVWCVFPSSDPRAAIRGIWTTTPTGSLLDGATFYSRSFGYTSASAAGVAGLAALILSANPALMWDEVKRIIRDACVRPRGHSRSKRGGHSPWYGYGLPHAGRAVRLALERGRVS